MVRLKDIGEADYDATKTQKKLDSIYSLNIVSDTAKAAQESTHGILIGAVAGLMGGYFLKKNIYWSAAFGALVGGVLGYSASKV
jgi:hypothetical protein